jgi:hypothetical protein
VLDQALGLLDHHLRHLDVAHRRLVEGGGDHLALHRALHVGDLLGPLVDQQHDEVAFRVIRRDRLRDVLHQHGLAGARRGDDEAALALADRGDDVDDSRRIVLARRVRLLELEPLGGIERRQVVEMDLVADLLRVLEIDRVDLEQGEIALALLRPADRPFHGVARAQAETADLRGGDVDVVRPRQVVRFRGTQEAEAVLQDLDHALADDLDVAGGELLEDREHQLLLAHGAGVLDLELFREGRQLGRRLGLEVLQLDFPHGGVRGRILSNGGVQDIVFDHGPFAGRTFARRRGATGGGAYVASRSRAGTVPGPRSPDRKRDLSMEGG